MRRTLLLPLLVPALALGIFFGAFAVSKLNVSGQPFLVSLSDFVFLNHGTIRQTLDIDVPPMTEERYQVVIGRTHHYVEQQAIWWLSRWGEAAVPHLAAEIRRRDDYARTKGAIRALGEIGGEQAAAALGELLASIDPKARYEQVYFGYTTSALGKIPLPSASRALIAAYERRPKERQILSGIGRTGTSEAVLYLLGLAANRLPQRPADDELIWGLAMSRSPEAARQLIDWMLTADPESARLCRDASDQFMREAALDPLLDALERADNDPLRAVILDLLDGRWVASSPRTVALLEPLLDDPWLAEAARDTLARSGSREAWLAVHRHLPTAAGKAWLVDDALFHVGYRFGAVALPELAQQLRAADPEVRRDTACMLPHLFLPEARAYLEPLLADSEPLVVRAARDALTQQDKVDLFFTFTRSLPEQFGRLAWENFRPDWFFMDFNYETGFEAVWNIFAWLHLGGLALSLLLGWALLTNVLRVFESYRFTLFLLFLLAEGFVGDFLFCDHWPLPPALGYRIATAVHLLLLVGFLARERERVPGELRNRIERLGGASLWLLLPLLLILGAPVYAEAMRLALRQWQHFSAFCLLLTVLAALVIEQALLPRHRLARHYGFERLLGFFLSAWLLVLFAGAVGRLAMGRLTQGDQDGALVCVLLLAPLPWFLLLHLLALRPREWFVRPPSLPAPPGGRLRLAGVGPEITVHLVPPRPLSKRLLRGGMKLTIVLTVAVAVAVLAGRGGDLEGMVLAVFAGVLGAALAGMLLQGIGTRPVIQVRQGFIRIGCPRFGGVLGASPWLRRLSMARAASMGAGAGRSDAESDDFPFTAAELAWLQGLQDGFPLQPKGQLDAGSVASYSRAGKAAADPQTGLPVQLGLRNNGTVPVTLAALEQASRGRFVTASVDGAPALLSLSLAARSRLIPPGADITLTGRVFPDVSVVRRGEVEVALRGPTVRSAPFRYPLQEDANG